MNTLRTHLATSTRRANLFLLRQDLRLGLKFMTALRYKNMLASTPVVSSSGPIVSLTTSGSRLKSVYLTLESIAAGTVLPSRLILWIHDRTAFDKRPYSIKLLEDRGLEVFFCDDYGPHTKYFPYLLSADAFRYPLVIAEENVLYSRWWLAGLVRAYQSDPNVIHCYRAKVVQMASGGIASLIDWEDCNSTVPSRRSLANGSSGCIYPPHFLTRLKAEGAGFLRSCPGSDDIWLHVNALRSGFETRQVGSRPLVFPFIPGTGLGSSQIDGLEKTNEQIKATYGPEEISLLLAETNDEMSAQGIRGFGLISGVSPSQAAD